MAIAIGLVLVALGINASITGDDAQDLPAQIESINPVRSATQVQQQEQVRVDLDDGLEGVFVVNGVEIPTVKLSEISSDAQPGAQVSLPKATIFEPGNYTLTFTPSEGAPIEDFTPGVNTVQVIYWKIVDGRDFAKSFTWQFEVI